MRIKSVAVGASVLALCGGFASAQGLDRDAEFEQARQQLEAAARRMAELAPGPQQAQNYFYMRGVPDSAPRAVLGVGIEDDERGVRVVGVTPGGGADEAGIETGDIITAMDGAALNGEGGTPAELLVAQMGNVDPGDIVMLTVLRDGDERDIEVEAQAPRGRPYVRDMRPGGPGMRAFDFTRPVRRWADMELVELTPGLGSYFGTETGVLVVRAPSDDALGLQDGDVILQIGGRTPMGVGHALRILASFEPGEQLELTVMREQRRRSLEVEIPRANGGD